LVFWKLKQNFYKFKTLDDQPRAAELIELKL